MSRVWSHRACEEFFLQGDRERELGLEVTPAFDRFAVSVAKVRNWAQSIHSSKECLSCSPVLSKEKTTVLVILDSGGDLIKLI